MEAEYDENDEIDLSFEELESWIEDRMEVDIPLDEFQKWRSELRPEEGSIKDTSTRLAETFDEIKEMAEKGCVSAYHDLVSCYYYGLGCERSYKEAARYCVRSILLAKNFSSVGMLERMKLLGKLDDADVLKVLHTLLEFAGNNDAAIARIAIMAFDGKLHILSTHEAFSILKRFYSERHCYELEEDSCGGEVPYYLGICMQDGIGTEKNPIVAKYLLDEAEDEYCWWDSDDPVQWEKAENILDDIDDRLNYCPWQIERFCSFYPSYGMYDEEDVFDAWREENELWKELEDEA